MARAPHCPQRRGTNVNRVDIGLVDLFAGCGGISSGFLRASLPGYRFVPRAAVELDVDAAATYSLNVSSDVYAGDIARWLASDLVPAKTEVDLILGGPPCQGFSTLGNQKARDVRNALWNRYVDAVRMFEPKFFVLENVREFLSSGQFTRLKRDCRRGGRLANYELEAFVLDASVYGSGQKRRRAIVIGRERGLPPLGEPTGYVEPVTVRSAFSGLKLSVQKVELPVREFLFDSRSVRGPFVGDDLHVTRNVTDMSIRRYQSIPVGGNRFDLPWDLQAPCWRKHKTGSGDVMGRLRWDQPSVTIRTEFFKPEKGRYLHPTEHRPITHLEAARLQGFPDDYRWCGNKGSIARQIGNAVPIPLAEAIGKHVLNAFIVAQASVRSAA
jgi:DNA (cytosine-5)-methyltransferase 1